MSIQVERRLFHKQKKTCSEYAWCQLIVNMFTTLDILSLCTYINPFNYIAFKTYNVVRFAATLRFTKFTF